jgi:alpha-tubulin suppressor-like RCC1 family protein
MKRWSERLNGKWMSPLLLTLYACVKASEPEAGSETHFLSNCESSCPAPYSCSCGVCTLACTSDSMCAAEYPEAACSAESEAESSCRAAPRVCDVSCHADAECAALGAGFVCRQGQCRTSAASLDSCANDSTCNDDSASGAIIPRLRVAPPTGPRSFKQLALGLIHGCALRNDGRVYCWGSNDNGALGTPPETDPERGSAKEVPGVNNGVALYAGGATTCLSRQIGAPLCWGQSFTEDLGGGGYSHIARSSPQTIDVLSDIAQLSLGEAFTCAQLADGEVRCWGHNYRGQLGDGTRASRAAPESALISSARVMRDALQIASGLEHSCALDQTRGVWCWGKALANDASDQSPDDALSATRIPLTNVVEVDVGRTHACALRAGGLVSCWGDNGVGQLGDGSTRGSESPVSVVGLSDAVDIALGGSRSCALKATGQVACWGYGEDGSLGTGSAGTQISPALVAELDDAYAIDSGDGVTCALSASRGTLCWGYNANGQVGDGTTETRARPVPVIFDEE